MHFAHPCVVYPFGAPTTLYNNILLCVYFMFWAIAVLGQSKLADVVTLLISLRHVRALMLAGTLSLFTVIPARHLDIFLARFFPIVTLKGVLWNAVK
jgi:hypothetical protein